MIPGLTEVDRMYDGANAIYVLKNDNSLWAFGENENGQLGNGTQEASATAQKIIDNVREMFFVENRPYAVLNDGSLVSWGYGEMVPGLQQAESVSGKPTSPLLPVTIRSGVLSFQTIYLSNFLLETNGHLLGWGKNMDGTLGNGSTEDVSPASPHIILTDVVDFSVGASHVVALNVQGLA